MAHLPITCSRCNRRNYFYGPCTCQPRVSTIEVPREPTEEMVTAAELRMPHLGRLQIRFLYESMIRAATGKKTDPAPRTVAHHQV